MLVEFKLKDHSKPINMTQPLCPPSSYYVFNTFLQLSKCINVDISCLLMTLHLCPYRPAPPVPDMDYLSYYSLWYNSTNLSGLATVNTPLRPPTNCGISLQRSYWNPPVDSPPHPHPKNFHNCAQCSWLSWVIGQGDGHWYGFLCFERLKVKVFGWGLGWMSLKQ